MTCTPDQVRALTPYRRTVESRGQLPELRDLPSEGRVHEVHGDGDVDALFLRRQVRPAPVAELAAGDAGPQLRGPGIFALLGGDPARHVPHSGMGRLAGQLAAALSRAL